MIEDLTMLANLPVADTEACERARKASDAAKAATGADDLAQAEADKAAAAETQPPPKRRDEHPAEDDTTAQRVARRGQDPPEQEKAGEEDS